MFLQYSLKFLTNFSNFFVLILRAYTDGLLKSVLFKCHPSEDGHYPSYETMSQHLNKRSHKISFLCKRENVGSTSFLLSNQVPIPGKMQHSFGVPRFFFRFSLTSAIDNQPFAYVHWSMVTLINCHRTSFECTMTRNEWQTGPAQRQHINPFCYVEDVVPSRFALGNIFSFELFTFLMFPYNVLYCI